MPRKRKTNKPISEKKRAALMKNLEKAREAKQLQQYAKMVEQFGPKDPKEKKDSKEDKPTKKLNKLQQLPDEALTKAQLKKKRSGYNVDVESLQSLAGVDFSQFTYEELTKVLKKFTEVYKKVKPHLSLEDGKLLIEAIGPARFYYDKLRYENNYWDFLNEVVVDSGLYPPLHKDLCDFVQDNLPKINLLILVPRGHFKSSVVTIGYALWRIAKDPYTRGLIANESEGIAEQFLSEIKSNLSNNKRFHKYWGDLSKEPEIWKKDIITVGGLTDFDRKKKGDTITAKGLASGATGTHYDWAILDDLVGAKNVKTAEGLAKPKEFYGELKNLVDPDETGRSPIIVVGTTWHFADFYADIQDKKSGFKKFFKVYKRPAYTGEWGTGELLFPTRWTWEALKDRKEDPETAATFSAQYMLDPIERGKNEFSMDFVYYDPMHIASRNIVKYVSLDPAGFKEETKGKDNDYSAMVCVGIDDQNNWFLIDIWKDKVKPKELVDQIFFWHRKHNPKKFAVETTAMQNILGFYIKEQMIVQHQFPRIEEIRYHERSKFDRILGLSGKYHSGTILHNPAAPHIKDFEIQLRHFPKGKNDDMIDALASIPYVAHKPKKPKSESPVVKHRGRYISREKLQSMAPKRKSIYSRRYGGRFYTA